GIMTTTHPHRQCRRRPATCSPEVPPNNRLCPAEVMAGQLDRLVSVSTLKTIRFGVIPFEVQLPVAPVHGFWIYHGPEVHVEHFTAELKIPQPQEVATYLTLFARLAEVARYDSDARALITRVLADLTETM